jgi:hypothetical protein
MSLFASLSMAIEAAAICMDLALLDWRQSASIQHPLLIAARDFMRGITVVGKFSLFIYTSHHHRYLSLIHWSPQQLI